MSIFIRKNTNSSNATTKKEEPTTSCTDPAAAACLRVASITDNFDKMTEADIVKACQEAITTSKSTNIWKTQEENMEKDFEVSCSYAFLEREPKITKESNPHLAAKFYKDLANDLCYSLYTQKNYSQMCQLLSFVALCNGRVKLCEKSGCVISMVFSFTDQGNSQEFLEYVKQLNVSIVN